ncbi:MAG TPA: MBL fold metallo-hydrolase [Ktedonobacterales bacterium]
MQDTITLQVGAARVLALNAGNLRSCLADDMAVPESVWRPEHVELFEQVGACPSYSVYIELGDTRALVDIGDYRATVTPESGYAIAEYTPPADIVTQLASLGVRPGDITDVVITHAHWDHFAGVTTTHDGEIIPTFPHARYFFGAADWAAADTQTALQDATSLEARTLGALRERGVLRLVQGQEPIADGVEVKPAPGETPGHLVVRVRSQGQTLYVLGDLFHHVIEVEHPDWMVTWAEPASMLATRRWLLQKALDEHALLVAAHIVGAGRIERTESGMRWQGA